VLRVTFLGLRRQPLPAILKQQPVQTTQTALYGHEKPNELNGSHLQLTSTGLPVSRPPALFHRLRPWPTDILRRCSRPRPSCQRTDPGVQPRGGLERDFTYIVTSLKRVALASTSTATA